MGGEADIWQPRTILELSPSTKRITQRFSAISGQTLFSITDFAYVVGTGALQVFKNGAYLTPGTDWAENSDTTFSLVVASATGDQVVAVGYAGITGTVDVRDTDIFISSYQNLRDYVGTETDVYVEGITTLGDGGQSFFQLFTGAGIGFYVDDNDSIVVPTGGDGSSAWVRSQQVATDFYSTAVDDGTEGYHLVSYPPLAGEVGATALQYYYGDPMRYGAVADGVTDDSAAVQAACDHLVNATTFTGSARWTPGQYMLNSEVTVDTPIYQKRAIFAYGVEIFTTGPIAGLRCIGGFRGGLDIYGMKINHRGNALATEGFLFDRLDQGHLKDCFVEAHGNGVGYAALRIQQSDPADTATGSFICKIENFRVGKRSGADIGEIPIGIDIQGSCNGTTIMGGSIGNTDICIKHGIQTGYTYVANALLIDGISFEGYGTAYQFVGAAGLAYGGARFINNRFEFGTLVYEIVGVTIDFAVPLMLSNNYYVSNAGTYITKPAAVHVNSFDVSITPGFSGMMDLYSEITARAHSSADHPFNAIPLGGNRGYNLTDNLGTSVASLAWTVGNKTRLISVTGAVANLALVGCRGIHGGGGAVERENLRGSATFAGAATVAVAFPTTNEPDANYHIVVTGDVNETFWITAKAVGGFTINSSNATSTAVVDWVLIG